MMFREPCSHIIYNHILKLTIVLIKYTCFLGHVEKAHIYREGLNKRFQVNSVVEKEWINTKWNFAVILQIVSLFSL